MKNIHLLPTDKPTWLHKSILTGVLRKSSSCIDDMKQAQGMNIYITSDEEIKKGDWHLNIKNNKISKYNIGSLNPNRSNYKKIILTTDQDLIKDGVQAIDDEFLEWFVKNPSCERVKVGEIYPSNCCINKEGKTKMNNDCMERNRCLHYKIIIPSKDDLKIGDNTNFGIITDINEKSVCFGKNKVGIDVWYEKSYVVKFPNLVLEEPKQETLVEEFDEQIEQLRERGITITHINKQETPEEVAERISKNHSVYETGQDDFHQGFILGAKWQSERMYSEEDMQEYAEFCIRCNQNTLPCITAKDWFEQFKKK